MRPTTSPRVAPGARLYKEGVEGVALPENPWALLELDLPQGEPWGYALAQALLKAPWADKLMEPAPGFLDLVRGELLRLKARLQALRQDHPLGPLGHRPPHPAEEGALRAILAEDPKALLEALRAHGPWPFYLYRAFQFNGGLKPIPNPRLPREDELLGYEEALATLRAQVERFLKGAPPLHLLLYGARGTGKSTAVKGLLRLEGANLIEVEPQALPHLEPLLEALAHLPKRFLLFLDDLSLEPGGEAFHHLKALLEGSLLEAPPNVLLVATSNRRHLLRHLSENPLPGEDPKAWDALQEELALADRFGLVLTFPPFDRGLYLRAVAHHLGRPLTRAEEEAALRFAQNRGYSGRTARQFALTLYPV